MAVFERFLKYLKSSQFLIRYFGIIFAYRWRGESRAVAAWKGARVENLVSALTFRQLKSGKFYEGGRKVRYRKEGLNKNEG